MESEDTAQMTAIREGGQEAIESVATYLDSVGIGNNVTMAEDCQPNQ